MGEIIGGIILIVVAAVCGIYASFTLRCKGPILSNPWLFMAKEERERELAKVDIKAEYRQLTIVFICISLIFGYLGINSFLSWRLSIYPLWIAVAFVIIYAIGSSVKFAMRGK